MSVKVMGLVFDSDLPQNEKFILLAYADHADHDGKNVFPSVRLIAWKTCYSDRTVRRITSILRKKGIMKPVGYHKNNVVIYNIIVKKLPSREPYTPSSPDKMTELDGVSPDKMTGLDDISPDKMTELDDLSPDICDTSPDICDTSPDICDTSPDIAMSYKPSLTINEPSVNRQHQNEQRKAWNMESEESPYLDNKDFLTIWLEYIQHRKEKKSSFTPTAGRRALLRLHKYPIDIAIRMIEKALESGWVGIHPLKPDELKQFEEYPKNKKERLLTQSVVDKAREKRGY